MAGNEANFFVRDATNGSTLPFRIFPGAPSNALIIHATTGHIGLGTTSPTNPLTIFENVNASSTQLRLENNAPVQMQLHNTDHTDGWTFNHSGSGSLIFDADASLLDGAEFTLDTAGNLTVAGNLVSGGAGTCNPGPCDGTFQSDFEVPTIAEHATFMWQNSHLWGVGPTPDSGAFNLTQNSRGMLHELEVAHIYIEQLSNRIQALEAKLDNTEN